MRGSEPTIADVVRATRARLERRDPSGGASGELGHAERYADKTAEWIVAHVLGEGSTGLALRSREPFPGSESLRLEALVARLCDGEPFEYVTGSAAFLGLELTVGPGVLIPRPETEGLAEWAIERAGRISKARVLDVGTGAGPLALAIADAVPEAQVHATDSSQVALDIATENVRQLGLNSRVHLHLADLLPGVPGSPERFDVVVANLPYVGTDETDLVSRSVMQHEPHEALFAGTDGLGLIRELLEHLPHRLAPVASIGLEIGWRPGTRSRSDRSSGTLPGARSAPDGSRGDPPLRAHRPSRAVPRRARLAWLGRSHFSRARPMTMRPLTIGVDASRSHGSSPTGTERYSTQVIEHLVVLGKKHRWRLYRRDAPAEQDHERISRSADIRVLPAPRAWTHTRLAWEAWRRPPDVLFIPAHVMPWHVRVPCVVTVHDLGHAAHPEAHTRSQRLYLELTTRRHVAKAAHLIADSLRTKDDLVQRYHADPGRVTVVHLGVDVGFMPASVSEVRVVRDHLGIPDGIDYLLHVGTIQPRKNLRRLITAFARIGRERPLLHLVLAGGRGWGTEDLEGHAQKLGIQGRVHLPGYVAEERLAALYSGAALVVSPSLYEGFGLPALEAMACGAPVAISGTSSLPEVTGELAYSFDPESVDSMASVLEAAMSDREGRPRRARLGRERAASFTWERCARSTLEVLEHVAQRRST